MAKRKTNDSGRAKWQRDFVASHQRKLGNKAEDFMQVGHHLYYAHYWTAIRSGVTRLLLQGQPGDVVEVADRISGLQIAVIRLNIKGGEKATEGNIDVQWTYKQGIIKKWWMQG